MKHIKSFEDQLDNDEVNTSLQTLAWDCWQQSKIKWLLEQVRADKKDNTSEQNFENYFRKISETSTLPLIKVYDYLQQVWSLARYTPYKDMHADKRRFLKVINKLIVKNQ